MDVAELETKLRELVRGQHSSLRLTFNEGNGPNYTSVGEWLELDPDYSGDGWVNDDERAKAVAENSMWTAHWYPDTPNGFCVLHASSLEALIDALPAE